MGKLRHREVSDVLTRKAGEWVPCGARSRELVVKLVMRAPGMVAEAGLQPWARTEGHSAQERQSAPCSDPQLPCGYLSPEVGVCAAGDRALPQTVEHL